MFECSVEEPLIEIHRKFLLALSLIWRLPSQAGADLCQKEYVPNGYQFGCTKSTCEKRFVKPNCALACFRGGGRSAQSTAG